MALGTFFSGNVKCDWCGQYIKNTDGGLIGAMGGDILKRAVAAGRKHFCSTSCKVAYEEHKNGKSVLDKDDGATAGATEKNGIKDALGGAIGGSFDTMFSNVKMQTQSKTDHIARLKEIPQIQFSGSSDEIQNQLNALFTEISGLKIGFTGTPEEKSLYKAIYEKLEFGIMKLRSAGGNAEADFFKQKFDKLKVLK